MIDQELKQQYALTRAIASTENPEVSFRPNHEQAKRESEDLKTALQTVDALLEMEQASRPQPEPKPVPIYSGGIGFGSFCRFCNDGGIMWSGDFKAYCNCSSGDERREIDKRNARDGSLENNSNRRGK